MPRKKFTDAQIALVVREVENGTKVEDVCRKLGVSEATIYNWKKRFVEVLHAPDFCERMTRVIRQTFEFYVLRNDPRRQEYAENVLPKLAVPNLTREAYNPRRYHHVHHQRRARS